MKSPFDFSHQHVFVAGGTSGINLCIALEFAKCGANVSVLSRSEDKVTAAVKQLSAFGGNAQGFAADVRNYDDISASFKTAVSRAGEISVLVSGAAGNFPAPILGMSSNAFKSVMDIDLLGTFNVMRAAHEHLKKPGASVVNISAPQSTTAMPMQGHVCAAKAGVDMITRTLAIEWGPQGIRVNAISPGPIENTEGMRRLAPTPEANVMVTKSVPLKRQGKAEEIAHACQFLSSPWGSYINGVLLPVDGGWGLGGVGSLISSMAGRA